ncbi:indolepyruvate/phenylpyruvate decarboxylase [Plasticicumulans sp.]|uniref:indolepyruvate/phenylpyruvate decarboxylase n=1 Tax=Plasticicumulans sp. TaxID=2307179 RepID=UPI003921D647
MNIALSLLHALKAHGAREIFGIPGDFALPFFRIVEESGVLPLYTLSHEPGIGFAADAAARFNGALGVAAVTYGAGALNMVNPVAGAYAERSPLVVISGAPGAAEVRSGMLLHHQVKTTDSQFAIYREITCAQTRLDDPATAPAEIARVLGACREQSRPVLIEVPRDAVALPCAPVRPAAPAAYDREAVEACAGEILARLAAAARPTLLVDIEVRRYGLEARVAELAHRLAIPVVTTFMGRGLLAEAAVPVAGTYLGVAGEPAVTALVEDSDCLLMLGVLLSDTNFGVSGRQIDLRKAVYAADRQVQIGFHHYPDLPLGALVEALLALVSDLDPPEPRLRPDLPPLPEAIVDGAPIAPDDIAAAIGTLMRRHGALPIASDIGDCLFTALGLANTALTAPGYYATMGFGVPAGLGIQATTGLRPLILVGDGAFQMTGWELGNCRRYGWDPIVIVFNNASWEMLHVFQPESAFNSLDEWRFAELAAALGGHGERVRTRRELHAALAAAHARRGRFSLIEAMIAPGALSHTLARYVEGFRARRARQAAGH